ncbi:hypothetical protein M0Q50_06090 [bacterium]|nr:hypothetical protein [bacterium]
MNIIKDKYNIDITSNFLDNISNDDVKNYINDNIIDYDMVIEITNKYDDYREFMKNEKPLYSKLFKLGCLKKYTKHMFKYIIPWDYELCVDEINKYDTYTEFMKNNRNTCYSYLYRNNLLYLLDKYDDKINKKYKNDYTEEYILEIIHKYDNNKDFRKNEINLYSYLTRCDKLYLLNGLVKKHKKYEISEILEHDYSKYKNVNQFNKENHALYSYACRMHYLYFIKSKINR